MIFNIENSPKNKNMNKHVQTFNWHYIFVINMLQTIIMDMNYTGNIGLLIISLNSSFLVKNN